MAGAILETRSKRWVEVPGGWDILMHIPCVPSQIVRPL